jgi:putative DNA primase/helicase
MNPTLDIYIQMGWPIFPVYEINPLGVCSCRSGADCANPGKHPRTFHGLKDATTDVNQVSLWDNQFPTANWGLSTGSPSGVGVIDIDTKDGVSGYESFERYEEDHGFLPPTMQAKTGGGGLHLLFQIPQGARVPSRVGWMPGVDIRGDGGYIVLPPGNHKSGERYEWVQWRALAEMPQYVIDDILKGVEGGGKKDLRPISEFVLNGIPEGERDDTLFRWACRLRRQHATDDDGGLAVVTELILAIAQRSNFPQDQALKKVEQAFKQDHSDIEDHIHPLTDVGNRNRFIELHGRNLRYVPEWGWMGWTPAGWRNTSDEEVIKLAEDVAVKIRTEESGLANTNKIKKRIMSWADRTESSGSLSSMTKLMKGDQRILRKVKDFDQQLTEVVCENGIVNLRTGKLRPITRDDMVTKTTGVVYDEDVSTDWWEEFIDSVTDGDRDLADYLQVSAGYSATGLTTQECFFVVIGPPASGKSTYIDGVMTALGGYAMNSQPDTFMMRFGYGPDEKELARFSGMRLISVSETRAGDKFNESLIKQLTGGDVVTARQLYKTAFDYRPQFKLWIGSNNDVISKDFAMLRRIKRIKFPKSIPFEQRDPMVKSRAKDRDTGSKAILKWIVQGAQKFLSEGRIVEPLSITASTYEYQFMTDDTRLFFNDCFLQQDLSCTVVNLYRFYNEWCRSMGRRAEDIIVFKKMITDRGITVEPNERGVESFRGIAPNYNAVLQV